MIPNDNEIIDLMEGCYSAENTIIDQDIEDEYEAEEGMKVIDDDYIPILDDDVDSMGDIEDDIDDPLSESALDLADGDNENVDLRDIVDELGVIN